MYFQNSIELNPVPLQGTLGKNDEETTVNPVAGSGSSGNISQTNDVRMEAEKMELQDEQIVESNINLESQEHDEFQGGLLSATQVKQTELADSQVKQQTSLTRDQVDKAIELVKLKNPLQEIRLW